MSHILIWYPLIIININYGIYFVFVLAIIYAFNVGSLKDAEENARQNGITIKQHNIIYKLVDDIKEEMNNCLPPVEVEDVQGILLIC